MRRFWCFCIWSSINIFTFTEVFPPAEGIEQDAENGRLRQVVEMFVVQTAEAEAEL